MRSAGDRHLERLGAGHETDGREPGLPVQVRQLTTQVTEIVRTGQRRELHRRQHADGAALRVEETAPGVAGNAGREGVRLRRPSAVLPRLTPYFGDSCVTPPRSDELPYE